MKFDLNLALLALGIVLLFLYKDYLFPCNEGYGDGALGPFSHSTGNYAYAGKPQREYAAQRLNFRYLSDKTNW